MVYNERVLFLLLTSAMKTSVTLSTDDLMKGVLFLLLTNFSKTLGQMAIYRVKLITWSERTKNFEISKKLAKFSFNCGTNETFCHNFGLKMNFIRL